MRETTVKPATKSPIIRLSDTKSRGTVGFKLVLTKEELEKLIAELSLLGLKRVQLEGTLKPNGRRDWHLSAQLGATVIQPCVVTLEPVTTRISASVERIYADDLPDLSHVEEVEMPEDDRVESIPEILDLRDLLAEALSLELPAYPRSPNADTVEMSVAPLGAEPITDEVIKPFAGLKSLMDKLSDTSKS
jgi:uncharacterized metal-binding protein YceD (DUF177 family)